MKTVTFNAPIDVEQSLKQAIDATGLSQTEIILEAIRDKLPQIVKEWAAKRSQAAEKFLGGSEGSRK